MAYNLQDHILRDYAAMHAGQDDEEEVFHHSFQFQLLPAHALALNVSSQVQTSGTPFSGPQTSSGPPKDEVAELTAAIAKLRAENNVLEREMEVAQLQGELHALQRRNAQLQKQTKQRSTQPQSQLTSKTLRSNPALLTHITGELERLGLSSSDSEDEENPSTCRAQGKKLQLKSGKTSKLTSHVVLPQS